MIARSSCREERGCINCSLVGEYQDLVHGLRILPLCLTLALCISTMVFRVPVSAWSLSVQDDPGGENQVGLWEWILISSADKA